MYSVKVTTGSYAGQTVNVESLQDAIREFGSNGFNRESFKPYEPKIVEYVSAGIHVSAMYDDGSSKDIATAESTGHAEDLASKLNAKL